MSRTELLYKKMPDEEKPTNTDDATGNPAPEDLHTSDEASADPETESAERPAVAAQAIKRRRNAYRPSHKATFIGLVVVAVILSINAAGLAYILNNQAGADEKDRESVTLSADTLNGLGVSRNSVGSENIELTIGPDTSFNGAVTIAGNTTVAGQLKLNGKFTAPEGSFAKLQGGDTSLEKLNVNGDATVSNLNLRKDLTVVGATVLQGKVTVSQLMTVNNNLNVAGSLSVGGTLAVEDLSVGDLTITGHLRVKGSRPSVSAGSLGSNGTVSVSGNDTAGTIAANVGAGGGGGGTIVTLTFSTPYSSTPHVVLTPVGRSIPGDYYINRSANGFSIVVTGSMGIGGYAFDYIVM